MGNFLFYKLLFRFHVKFARLEWQPWRSGFEGLRVDCRITGGGGGGGELLGLCVADAFFTIKYI